MKNILLILCVLFFLSNCERKENKISEKMPSPTIENNGAIVKFNDTKSVLLFKSEKISKYKITEELKFPGKIAASVLASQEGASQNIILFDNPDLAENYTQLIQHQININQIQNITIKQKQIELDRVQDLYSHGAATGQDLLNAQSALYIEQTNLANEKTALIEHESKLKSAGFDPEALRNAKPGTIFVICDIPENLISKIKEGQICTINFAAYPNEEFSGKIDAIADLLDNSTRMAKVRIIITNLTNKLKSGMYADVIFQFNEDSLISINKNSLVTVQGKNYVFIKKSNNQFERREIQIGQQIGNQIIVLNGLNIGDEVVVEGVMQLKGLSFGY